MDDNVPGRFRARRAGCAITYLHHFKAEIFCQILDQIGIEMEQRFSESTTELLTCIACLDPKNSFSNFNVSSLLRLAEMYPQDFSKCEKMELKGQLELWIDEMRENEKFAHLQNFGDLAQKMIEVGIHNAFYLVYRLIELILVLPVATATVERAFSAMAFIKTDLRNKMGDEFLNDCLICYIEKDIFKGIDNEVIIQHFQNMKTRRMNLPPLPIEEPKDTL
ncbi:unnamed protein product [Rhodiola kirilowii]